MEVKKTYATLKTAQTGIDYYQAKGWRVLHENHVYREGIVEDQSVSVFDHVEIIFDDAPDNTPLPITDWKARFLAASTDADKLAIVAERLGLK